MRTVGRFCRSDDCHGGFCRQIGRSLPRRFRCCRPRGNCDPIANNRQLRCDRGRTSLWDSSWTWKQRCGAREGRGCRGCFSRSLCQSGFSRVLNSVRSCLFLDEAVPIGAQRSQQRAPLGLKALRARCGGRGLAQDRRSGPGCALCPSLSFCQNLTLTRLWTPGRNDLDSRGNGHGLSLCSSHAKESLRGLKHCHESDRRFPFRN